MEPKIVPIGDLAVSISFGTEINEETNQLIRNFSGKLQKGMVRGIVEWVPAYTTITLYYEPDQISYENLRKVLMSLHDGASTDSVEKPFIYEIPVLYGGKMGPDLDYIAKYTGLSEKEIISLHSNRQYLIHMIGFTPGFPYLGGLPEEIAVPRLEIPRNKVVPGSIGIGGTQTGIYPTDVPSGWRIIGVTPVNLFDPKKENPFLLKAGNYIKFIPIEQEQFLKIKNLGTAYKVRTYRKE